MKWKATVYCEYVGSGNLHKFEEIFEAETREEAQAFADSWACRFDSKGFYAGTPVVEPIDE